VAAWAAWAVWTSKSPFALKKKPRFGGVFFGIRNRETAA
jgi:hypothetical protein